ncbi:site-specific integrase [uncultured Parabacteroides sp.]|uniref:tyrosine-type recombinase/integrase n=1 Tax=uncultured Parabacteroides sp. TaxID=512312 RepID=UPI0026310645|nr:site-specific integrase [uncultured Parabacteroides sp.]
MKENGLVEGMREYMDLLRKEGRYSSAKSYQDALNSFIRFNGTERVSFLAVNKDSLRRYEAYLLGNGCMRNTISTYMRRIRCVYNRAVEEGKAPYIHNLFKNVFTGVESKRKKALPQEEMYRLMTVRTEEPALCKAQTALCLMFLYGGMAFVDFAHLKADNFKEGILDYKRQKTGTPMRIEVLAVARTLSEKLAGMASGSSGYLYPFLCGTKADEEGYKEYNTALARFNRNLKALARVAGITSVVTSYTIRHSFATTLKDLEVSVEMISELLGHKSITTTQIYLKSFSLERMTAVNNACFNSVYNYVQQMG